MMLFIHIPNSVGIPIGVLDLSEFEVAFQLRDDLVGGESPAHGARLPAVHGARDAAGRVRRQRRPVECR